MYKRQNLSVALAARRANPSARVVARIFEPTLAARLPQTLGVDAVLSLAAEAAPTFVGAALFEDVLRGFVLGDRLCLVVRRTREAATAVERPLLVRSGREGPFVPVAPGGPAEGDEVIALRWIRLGPPG